MPQDTKGSDAQRLDLCTKGMQIAHLYAPLWCIKLIENVSFFFAPLWCAVSFLLWGASGS
jgi:hypothetical protein